MPTFKKFHYDPVGNAYLLPDRIIFTAVMRHFKIIGIYILCVEKIAS